MFPLAIGSVAPAAPGGRPVIWAATGRSGGTSAPPYESLNLATHVGDDPISVDMNRGRVLRLLGLAETDMAVMNAVHGADVEVVGSPGTYAGVDCLVTQQPGLALLALGADCVPLALIGADGVTIAAVHCGWRGLAADVVGSAVAAFGDLGTGVRAAILGPSICGTCYPVPESRSVEVAARVSQRVAGAALIRTPDGQPGIDVREGLRVRLVELGVAPSAITSAGGCTAQDPDLFSFRRDNVTGRQGIAVCSTAMMDA